MAAPVLASVSRLCLVALTVVAWTAAAAALEPAQPLDRYVHQTWTTEQGLPQNSVYALVHGRDGYLWLGTDEGLVRFDGLRFTGFDRLATHSLRDQVVFALYQARDGALWIGTDRGGVSCLRDGRFTHVGAPEGLPPGRVQAIAEDGSGAIWVGMRGGGLARVAGGAVTSLRTGDGLSDDDVLALAADDTGLWVGTAAGLDRVEGGHVTRLTAADGLPPGAVRALHLDRRGRLWVGTIGGPLGTRLAGGGLAVRDEGRFRAVPLGLPGTGVMALQDDGAGTLWIATSGQGVARLRADGTVDAWALAPAPADDLVWALALDGEGALWLGTQPGGLHRLGDSRLQTITWADGLLDEVVESLFEDRDGAMWIGTHAGGVCRRAAVEVRCLTMRDGLPHDRVNAILQDADGTLWFGTEGGLARMRAGRVTTFGTAAGLPTDHVNALLRDRDGVLWVGTWGGGVARLAGERFRPPASEPAGRYVNTLFQDGAGRVWAGTTEGLGVWTPDGAVGGIPAAAREPQGVEALHEDGDGLLWIGTRRDGLFLLRGDRLTQFTVADGLFDNLVGTLVEDGRGDFWISCNKGIFRVARRALLAAARGTGGAVVSRAFGTADGMKTREANFGQGRWAARDGRLWFATVGGVVVADPARLVDNVTPPVVHVEDVLVDGEPLGTGAPIVVAAGRRRIEFRFIGLSLSAPGAVRYRYMLEGFDDDWIDGREARAAHYTNVPPGQYRFRVMAANGDGVWNARGDAIALSVEAPLWRRPWVAATLVAAALGLVLVAFQTRLTRLRREEAQQAEFSRRLLAAHEDERRRLAGELHDGIGQHLLVIGNWARLALSALDSPPQARPPLEVIAETAARSVRDIRALTRELQPYEMEHVGLGEAVKGMLRRLGDASGVSFVTRVGTLAPRPPEQAINIFRIVQEAANNVVKHAEATEAQVVLEDGPQGLEVRVTDNGRGLPTDGAAPSGFGLRSLATRAQMLGGTCTVESSAGRGTTVTVRVPPVPAEERA